MKRRPVDWPRVRTALSRLDRLLEAHPELRGRLDVAAAELTAAEHEAALAPPPSPVTVAELAALPPANDTAPDHS